MYEYTITVHWKDGTTDEWPGFESAFKHKALAEAQELLRETGQWADVERLSASYHDTAPSSPMTMADWDRVVGL